MAKYLGQYFDRAKLTHKISHHNGVLFDNKKQWTVGTHNNLDGSLYSIEKNTGASKGHESIYITFQNKNTNVENRLVVDRVKDGGETGQHDLRGRTRGSLW